MRIRQEDIARLANLQMSLLRAAKNLVRAGGELIYSVCTTTKAETLSVASEFTKTVDGALPVPVEDPIWRRNGEGGLILPQDHGTDGMSIFKWKIE